MSEVTPASTRFTLHGGGARTATATDERGESPDGALQARDEVEQRHADLHRRPIGVAGHRHQPGDGLRQQVVSGTFGIGAGKATHGGDNEVRVALAERIGLEAQAQGGRRPIVVDEQIAARQEAVQGDATFIGAQVEHDAALVAIDRCEVGAAPIRRIAPPRRPPVSGSRHRPAARP